MMSSRLIPAKFSARKRLLFLLLSSLSFWSLSQLSPFAFAQETTFLSRVLCEINDGVFYPRALESHGTKFLVVLRGYPGIFIGVLSYFPNLGTFCAGTPIPERVVFLLLVLWNYDSLILIDRYYLVSTTSRDYRRSQQFYKALPQVKQAPSQPEIVKQPQELEDCKQCTLSEIFSFCITHDG